MSGETMRPHEEMLDLVAVYALGALPAAEARSVSEHIVFCDECRTEYEALRPVADALGYAAEEPVDQLRSARMKSKLLARVRPAVRAEPARDGGAAARKRTPLWPAYFVAAAAVVIALLNVVTTLDMRSQLAGATDRVAQLQLQYESAVRTQARDREMIADIVAADGKHLPVPGGEVVARRGHLYMAMDQLAAPPAGRVYQAWTLARGASAMKPSVTFVPNKSGVAVIALPEPATNLSAVAVSVEPTGGSLQPTTKPLFVRTLE